MNDKPDPPVFTGYTIEPLEPPEGADLSHAAFDIGIGNKGEEPLVYLRVCLRCFAHDLIDVIATGEPAVDDPA